MADDNVYVGDTVGYIVRSAAFSKQKTTINVTVLVYRHVSQREYFKN